jgi:hypothetical protein
VREGGDVLLASHQTQHLSGVMLKLAHLFSSSPLPVSDWAKQRTYSNKMNKSSTNLII